MEKRTKKNNTKCVFRFILDHHVSANLEWWIYVGFFAHLPAEDCIVKCGLCSVCVTSLANPPTPTPHSPSSKLILSYVYVIETWLYQYLLCHPPLPPLVYFLEQFLIKLYLRTTCKSSNTSKTVFTFMFTFILFFFKGLCETCKEKKKKTVFELTYAF